MLTGATLLDDVEGPPPPPKDVPQFTILFVLGSAEPKSSTLTDFSHRITNLRVLGSAEPRIPWDRMGCRLTGSTETLCPLELPQLH